MSCWKRVLLITIFSIVSLIGIRYVSVYALPTKTSASHLLSQVSDVTLSSSKLEISFPCPAGLTSTTGSPGEIPVVLLKASVNSPDRNQLSYDYSTTGGRIIGEGPDVKWDLSGVTDGTYIATVEVSKKDARPARGARPVFASTTVTVSSSDCHPACPTVRVDCSSGITQAGTPVTFDANIEGFLPDSGVTYHWSVSAGTIKSGQGTPSITVATTGLDGQSVTATLKVGGLPPECQTTVSCTSQIGPALIVDCPPDNTPAGTPVKFNANVGANTADVTATYNWSVSAGTISSGQGTPSITVDTEGLGGQSITATVKVGGLLMKSQTTASCVTQIQKTATPPE